MDKSKKLNYKSSEIEKFLIAINPNIEVDEQGYVWFNSSAGERDNAYPNKLIDLYNNASPVHSNFINLKANLMFGSGLLPLDTNDEQIKMFLDRKNRAGQSINDIFKKACFDMALMEAAALQVVYNSEGMISEIYHCNPSYLRAESPNTLGFVENWYYSTKWGIVQNKRNRKPSNMKSDAVKIAAFNPANGKKDKRQILYIKKYSPSLENVYAIPSYNSVLNWVQLDFELSQFHLNKVQNSLTPSGILYLKGNPTDEEKAQFVNNFKIKHTGSENAGKLLFIWGDYDDQSKPELVRLEGDVNQGLYEELSYIVTEKIAIGHGGNLELSGSDAKGASLGGDANKLAVSVAYFTKVVITPLQETILSAFNDLLKFNGMGQLVVINEKLNLESNTISDTNQSGNNNNTDNEVTPTNEITASLTGKQYINMMRLVRNIKNGKINKEAGIKLLEQSYALDQETIELLITDEQEDDKIVIGELN